MVGHAVRSGHRERPIHGGRSVGGHRAAAETETRGRAGSLKDPALPRSSLCDQVATG